MRCVDGGGGRWISESALVGGVPALRMASKLGLGAAVARGGALARGCTRLRVWSVEERASVHGTVGLLVETGES